MTLESKFFYRSHVYSLIQSYIDELISTNRFLEDSYVAPGRQTADSLLLVVKMTYSPSMALKDDFLFGVKVIHLGLLLSLLTSGSAQRDIFDLVARERTLKCVFGTFPCLP